MLNINFNEAKNGIEIRFDEKPESSVLAALKENGFRWSGKQKIWYAKQTDERIEFVKKLNGGEEISVSNKTKHDNKRRYDLFALTRTDNIENNYAKYYIRDTKELAAIFRKHLRERFPMCKWSVRKVDYNSVSITLKSSPYAIDSDEVMAITEYAYRFADSYNYDNSDIMTDYFDVNFYGVNSRYSIIDKWDYEQTEPTIAEANISAEFAEKLMAYNKMKEEEERRAFEEEEKRREEEAKKAEEYRIKREANHKIIEGNAEVNEAEYFVLDCLSVGGSKNDSVEEYFTKYDGIPYEEKRVKCSVAREVHFSEDVYNMFTEQLLDYFTFIEGDMGGTATDDLRINSFQDYERMSDEEKTTVEFYYNKCIAVFCGDKLKLVIDPQGYSYARYVYFVDEKSKIVSDYKPDSGVDTNVAGQTEKMASKLESAAEEIISKNDISDTFDGLDFDLFRKEIKSWVKENKFPISEEIIRASKKYKLKSAMYRVLDETNPVIEQLEDANLEFGQKITIIMFNEFGSLVNWHGYFNGYEVKDYAQYKDCVFLKFRMYNKRKDTNIILHNGKRCIIFDGFIDFPEDLLWDVWTNDVGWVMRKTKYASCDNKQLDVILNYFDSNGVEPVINTYKPQF